MSSTPATINTWIAELRKMYKMPEGVWVCPQRGCDGCADAKSSKQMLNPYECSEVRWVASKTDSCLLGIQSPPPVKMMKQNTITFVKVVRYTQCYTKKEFMEIDFTFGDGTDLKQEDKEKMWKKLVERSSACGEIMYDDECDEKDERHGWTDDVYEQATDEVIDEIQKERTTTEEVA